MTDEALDLWNKWKKKPPKCRAAWIRLNENWNVVLESISRSIGGITDASSQDDTNDRPARCGWYAWHGV